jgi:thiaminase
MPPPAPPKPAPSLANHLLCRDPDGINAATQQPFLSHAGCGTISSAALTQWLAQDAHISREFVSFVGRLIGKMRLPDTAITMENTTFRTFDLLISTLNNVRREMSFFDTTASKYGLQIEPELPKPATKGYVDLLASASGSGASLLEGLVLLWTTEHVSSGLYVLSESRPSLTFLKVLPSLVALRQYLHQHKHNHVQLLFTSIHDRRTSFRGQSVCA